VSLLVVVVVGHLENVNKNIMITLGDRGGGIDM
jgi:hypothetical protein